MALCIWFLHEFKVYDINNYGIKIFKKYGNCDFMVNENTAKNIEYGVKTALQIIGSSKQHIQAIKNKTPEIAHFPAYIQNNSRNWTPSSSSRISNRADHTKT